MDLYDRNQHCIKYETVRKHFVRSFVRPSHFEAYIVTCFAFVYCLVKYDGSQACGEMIVDLLADKKHLNRMSGSFSMRLKSDKRNFEADVTAYVRTVALIQIFVQKRCICPS